MTLTLLTVPCLDDNYAFIIANETTKEAAVIDAPEAAPINAALAQTDYRLTTVLLSHHHWDHIDGLDGLRGREGLQIIGAKADAHRLPPLDHAVTAGDTITVCGEDAQIIDAPGHTIGHIVFHFPQSKLCFTMDTLMALGCGRLFEGTPAQMWDTMQKLRTLPDDTLLCSGHEYAATNAAFAATIEPHNQDLISRTQAITAARAKGISTVPSLLSLEKATNPYLRADNPALKSAMHMASASDLEVFTEIRKRRDSF